MKFNHKRLCIARKRRLLNKKEFAELVDLNPHTILRCEGGKTEPTTENIDAFARALKFPRGFFFGPDIDEAEGSVVSFRSQTAMSAAIREAALAAGSLGFLVSDWVEQKFNLPEVNVPDLHLYAAEPESAARTLRQEWALGEKPISNMIQLLESKGVRVFSLNENTAVVNAYSLWRNKRPYVFLNTFKSSESSRFDCAHELAHLVLHQDGEMTGRLAEEQANRFASAFLMPSSDVLAVIPSVRTIQQLVAVKARWKVSLAALNYRAHRLGITSDWKYRDFCIEIVTRGFNKTEPNEIQREVSVVWQKVLTALWAENLTHENIAHDLSIPISELGGLLFGMLAPPPSEKPKVSQPLELLQGDNCA